MINGDKHYPLLLPESCTFYLSNELPEVLKDYAQTSYEVISLKAGLIYYL